MIHTVTITITSEDGNEDAAVQADFSTPCDEQHIPAHATAIRLLKFLMGTFECDGIEASYEREQ